MARTDCVCSGAQRAPSRGDSTAAGHWCTAALPDVSLRGHEVAVAISQCPVESLENLRRKRKPFHRDSFCQNVFDISGKGGYNKDVETRRPWLIPIDGVRFRDGCLSSRRSGMEADMYSPCGKYPEGGDTYNTSGPVLGTFDSLADLPDHRLAPKW